MTLHLDPVTGDIMVDVLASIDRNLLNQTCLDHGFVKVLDCMPRLVPASMAASCDFAIADAARISYQKGTRKVNADAGLVDHLIRNAHSSPVEMGKLKLHCRMPLFVARQWIRHRTGNFNEESARYSELAADFYVPDADRWAMNTAANKQSTVQYAIDPQVASALHAAVTRHNEGSYKLYQELLTGGDESDIASFDIPGIAREQARMVLGVNIYTQWVWCTDLRNLLHFLKLRTDPHAQYEIRVFADAIARVVAALFPATWASFKDHYIDGVNFGSSELQVLAEMSSGALATAAKIVVELGWTLRRFDEFHAKVQRSKLCNPVNCLEVRRITFG